jgi:hypothetical protein
MPTGVSRNDRFPLSESLVLQTYRTSRRKDYEQQITKQVYSPVFLVFLSGYTFVHSMFLVKEIRTQRKRSVRKERDPCAKKEIRAQRNGVRTGLRCNQDLGLKKKLEGVSGRRRL